MYLSPLGTGQWAAVLSKSHITRQSFHLCRAEEVITVVTPHLGRLRTKVEHYGTLGDIDRQETWKESQKVLTV